MSWRRRHLSFFRAIGTAFLGAVVCAGCSGWQKRDLPRQIQLEPQWTRSTYQREHLGYRYLHRASPVLFEDLVIQSNATDGLVAFGDRFGQLRWKREISLGVEGGVVEAGGRLFFASSAARFFCLDARSGKTIWTFDFRSEGLAKATVTRDTVYFVNGTNVLYALDRESGAQKWLYSRRDSAPVSIRGASQPLVEEGRVYAGFGDGFVVALAADNGRQIWEREINSQARFRDVDAQPILVNGVLYVAGFDSGLVALRATNGEVVWRNDDGGYDAVTVVDKVIFYSTSDGRVLAVDLSTGKQIWSYTVESGYATRPTHFRGLLVVGESSGDAVVLNASTGRRMTSFSSVRGVASPVAVRDSGELYFVSRDANLFKLQLAWRRPQDFWPWEIRR
jgi:outer membrane protein assembly factor BamB